MDLNHLGIFRVVAEALSFSVAARQLGVPRSTVSRAVTALEAHVGARLLQRTTRQVVLTAAGEALLGRVAGPLAELQQATGSLPEETRVPRGLLRVTATADLAQGLLAEPLAAFCRRHPQVRVDVQLTARMMDLVAERVDVAFRLSGARLRDSTHVAQRLGTLRMGFYAAPAHVAVHGLPRRAEDVEARHWVAFSPALRLQMEGPEGTFRVPGSAGLQADDMTFVRQVLRAGAGVGVMPEFMAEEDVAAGKLVQVLPRWSLSTTLWMLSPGGAHPPARLVAFRAFLTGPAGRALMPRSLRMTHLRTRA